MKETRGAMSRPINEGADVLVQSEKEGGEGGGKKKTNVTILIDVFVVAHEVISEEVTQFS